ncbi:MAG: hypothetical protein Q8R67_22180 [Rhodoferax sp.]|nr:hypothetical protein [Rhodoferax sp.]MDP3654382.1 hypothetical protein [Rhodoferax sp.]
MSNKAIVLDANILIRAVLGKRVRELIDCDMDLRPRGALFGGLILVGCIVPKPDYPPLEDPTFTATA